MKLWWQMMKEYKDPEVLTELYHQKEMSQPQIAEKFGVCHNTIQYWMDKHNIQTRKATSERPPYYYTGSPGYKVWQTEYNGKRHEVFVHRLLAVSKFGYDAVINKDVHHRNGCKIDNRPENIEVMTHAEHTKLHKSE